MPNRRYLELQQEFYALEFPLENERSERVASFADYLDCVWITADWKVIPIQFMKQDHLYNAYRATWRQLTSAYADEERSNIDFVYRYEMLQHLQGEIKRRKLPVPPTDERLDKLYLTLLIFDDGYNEDWQDEFYSSGDNMDQLGIITL